MNTRARILLISAIFAAVITFLLSLVWFSPAMFLEPWLELNGMRIVEYHDGLAISFLIALAGSVLSVFLHLINDKLSESNVAKTIGVAILAWAALLALPYAVQTLRMGVSFQFWLVETGYSLFALTLVAMSNHLVLFWMDRA